MIGTHSMALKGLVRPGAARGSMRRIARRPAPCQALAPRCGEWPVEWVPIAAGWYLRAEKRERKSPEDKRSGLFVENGRLVASGGGMPPIDPCAVTVKARSLGRRSAGFPIVHCRNIMTVHQVATIDCHPFATIPWQSGSHCRRPPQYSPTSPVRGRIGPRNSARPPSARCRTGPSRRKAGSRRSPR
ncbi:hypothetical protein LCGC14_0246620 [marine sediment metagenome]|uniref:Uncharacterized protein n=1 Tax=marine sediment metagenome TaxID=412755 RepID=A0A0F9WQR1_9ZZZZ